MQPFEPMSWDELPESAKSLLPQDAPPTLKIMAARSLLPMGTTDLINVLFYLSNDEDQRIRRSARRSLIDIPPELVATILSENLSEKILHWYANRDLPAEHYELIALNRRTADETIAFMAGNYDYSRLLDIISANQARMLRHHKILVALLNNHATPLEVSERVRSFIEITLGRSVEEIIEEQTHSEQGAMPEEEEIALSEDNEESVSTEPLDTVESNETFEEHVAIPADELPDGFNLDQLVKEVFEHEDDFAAEFLIDPEQELSATQRTSLTNRIRKMTVLDKMRLALKGNIEARQILMKNPNKMIQECVLRNPRMTLEEVIRISKDKTMREELIRMVTTNKEWVKNYEVVHQLCWNPKTPITQALKFINRLNIKDIIKISKSKQVPGMLAVAARKVAEQKQRYR